MSNIPWDKIEKEYVTTHTSYRKLGEKYGVSYVTIAKRAQDKGWGTRKKIQNNRTAKKVEAALDAIAEKNAVGFVKELEDARTITEKALQRALELLNAPDTDDHYLSGRDLNGITRAIRDCVQLMREFYNVPTPAQAEASRIAAERLELERKRLEAGAVDDTDSAIEVTFVDLDETET